MLIDCHVHLDAFSEEEVAQILQRAGDAGVAFVISAGTTLDSSLRSVKLSAQFPELFSGVGIHPMDIREPFNERTYVELKRLAQSTDKVLVMSEIGLDFMEGCPERELQYPAFREQVRLALELGMPIVFHSREAHAETLRVLREEQAYKVRGVMHYFQADEETAGKAIDLGFYISLARPLLRLPHLQRLAAGLALEHIVLETDAAPQPFKAKRRSWTEPRHLREVVERLAELQGRPVEEVLEVTGGNVRRLLGPRWAVVEKHLGLTNDVTQAPVTPQWRAKTQGRAKTRGPSQRMRG